MKYSDLRNKQVGDKDLEMKRTYKKKRLQEVQLQELMEEAEENNTYCLSEPIQEAKD